MKPTRHDRFEPLFRANYAAVRRYAQRRAPADVVYHVVQHRTVTGDLEDGRTIGMVREFLTYERLPLDEEQLDLDPHPGATCSAEANQPGERELGFVNPCRER